MIIWKGLGFFIAVFISIAYLFCKWLFELVWPSGTPAGHPWMVNTSLLLAAVLCAVFSYAIKQPKTLLLLAKLTNSPPMVEPHKTHSFFFIPIRFWPLILFLVGAGLSLRLLYS